MQIKMRNLYFSPYFLTLISITREMLSIKKQFRQSAALKVQHVNTLMKFITLIPG